MVLNRSETQITVVTVCLNAEDLIERTIRSVATQSFEAFEYLIIDGCSRDKTLTIAEKYAPYFRKRGITYKILSEKDAGIYDAMNKSLKYPRGEWIIFMNAGDTFYDRGVLAKYSSEMTGKVDVIYGDVLIHER